MNQLITNLAKAVVYSGVNVQPGQEVLVRTSPEAAELAREVVKLCYERGAKRVITQFSDGVIGALDMKNQTLETLTNKPEFMYATTNYIAEVGGCLISILCADPNVGKDLDAEKMALVTRADMPHLKTYYEKAMSNKIKWSIIAYPHPAWAKLMFPELGDAEAYDKLAEYIKKTTRVDSDDPVAAWKVHADNLRRRCQKLNDANIDSFRYKNKAGTDVTVGMPDNYVFAGGAEECNGEMFNANMPTEEVFSAPDYRRVNGKIVASMPLCYGGKIIEGIELELKDGVIVSYKAKTNEAVLKGIIETDEGSHRLGEIALVPYDSPISSLHTLFYETLFDENASCHFAIGRAYPTCVKGGGEMTEEQRDKAGLNFSDMHVDFMVGTKDLEITATTKDGKTLKVFEKGNFTKEFE